MCIVILLSCALCPFINYSEVLAVCQVYVKNIFHYYNNSNIFYRNFGKCILSCFGIKFKRNFILCSRFPKISTVNRLYLMMIMVLVLFSTFLFCFVCCDNY